MHKWYFDELYDVVFVRPVLCISPAVADVRHARDRLAGRRLGAGVTGWSRGSTIWIDRLFVDGLVNGIARLNLSASGLRLRRLQTGNLRQYVMFIVVGTVALFVLISLYWNFAIAAVTIVRPADRSMCGLDDNTGQAELLAKCSHELCSYPTIL